MVVSICTFLRSGQGNTLPASVVFSGFLHSELQVYSLCLFTFGGVEGGVDYLFLIDL